jgi:hypothetical protein
VLDTRPQACLDEGSRAPRGLLENPLIRLLSLSSRENNKKFPAAFIGLKCASLMFFTGHNVSALAAVQKKFFVINAS